MFCVLCVSCAVCVVVCITRMICVLYVLCVYICAWSVVCVCCVLYDWRISITLHSVQVMVFPMNCSQCQSPCETRMKSVGIH